MRVVTTSSTHSTMASSSANTATKNVKWDPAVVRDTEEQEEDVRAEFDSMVGATQELPDSSEMIVDEDDPEEAEDEEEDDNEDDEFYPDEDDEPEEGDDDDGEDGDELDLEGEDSVVSYEASQDLLEGAVKKTRCGAGSSKAATSAKKRKASAVLKAREEALVTSYLDGRKKIEAKRRKKLISHEQADQRTDKLFKDYKNKTEQLKASKKHGGGGGKQAFTCLQKNKKPAQHPKKNKLPPEPKVIDLSLKKSKEPIKMQLDSSMQVTTEQVSVNRGNSKGFTYEALAITRMGKEKGKQFSFQIPMRHISFVNRAIQNILASCSTDKVHDIDKMTPEQIDRIKPNKEGFKSLFAAAKSEYSRDKYVDYPFEIRVDDATFKSANGLGSYEALVIEKKYTSKEGAEKTFEMDIPIRYIPILSAAVGYVAYMRRRD